MHELAHNDISEHNEQFHQLNAQLRKQYQQYTKMNRSGRTLSQDEVFDGVWEYDQSKEEQVDHGAETTFVLRSATPGMHSQDKRTAIKEAAERRIAKK
jgi:DNA/RNA-binding domain of Phe-tRNA-synthetase-like protein